MMTYGEVYTPSPLVKKESKSAEYKINVDLSEIKLKECLSEGILREKNKTDENNLIHISL